MSEQPISLQATLKSSDTEENIDVYLPATFGSFASILLWDFASTISPWFLGGQKVPTGK